jgi:glycerol kinase
MSVGYEEALLMCRIEAEQCTCRWDEESGTPIQDGCLWHSESAREEEEQAQLAAEEARARGEGSEG